MFDTRTTTTMTRLRASVAGRLANPKGLALLDVLIGMAIFALIAITAVVALGQFRQRAFESQVLSDAQALSVAIEGQMTNGGQYPTELKGSATTPVEVTVEAPATGFDLKHVLTKNNSLYGYKYVDPTPTTPASFFLCIEHQSNGKADAHALYDALKGGIVSQSSKEGCSTVSTYSFS